MLTLEYIDLTLTTAYLKSSCQSWDLPGWHQRPPGLPAPSLLQVVGMRIGETRPPTGATGPAAHNAQMHHLVDNAVRVCVVERGRKQGKGERGSRLIQNATQAYLNETEPELIYKRAHSLTACFISTMSEKLWLAYIHIIWYNLTPQDMIQYGTIQYIE